MFIKYTLAAFLPILSVAINAETPNNRFNADQQITRGESRGGEGRQEGGSERNKEPGQYNRSPGYNRNEPTQHNEAGRGAAYEHGVQNAEGASSGSGSGSVYVSPEDAYNPYAPSNTGNQGAGDSWGQ